MATLNQGAYNLMALKDEDVVLLRAGIAHRFGPGEIKKIIDDAISRKDRHPLEYYYLLVKELERFKK